jgi:tRNA A37 N6-isopentenylltransferase MiaA
MFMQGWLEEVAALMGTDWQQFLQEKKLIGYNEIINFLCDHQTEDLYKAMIATIAQRTRHYAKRQHTFWNMLQRNLKDAADAGYNHALDAHLEVLNLTTLNIDLYIKQLSKRVSKGS